MKYEKSYWLQNFRIVVYMKGVRIYLSIRCFDCIECSFVSMLLALEASSFFPLAMHLEDWYVLHYDRSPGHKLEDKGVRNDETTAKVLRSSHCLHLVWFLIVFAYLIFYLHVTDFARFYSVLIFVPWDFWSIIIRIIVIRTLANCLRQHIEGK